MNCSPVNLSSYHPFNLPLGSVLGASWGRDACSVCLDTFFHCSVRGNRSPGRNARMRFKVQGFESKEDF